MMHNGFDRLEIELQSGLHAVSAPPDLWDRVQLARTSQPRPRPRGLVWVLATALVLAAAGLLWVRSPGQNARRIDFNEVTLRCQNPAQLRAWVRAQTGLDVPFRHVLPASIQLIGARKVANGVEVDYRAANREAALMVSRAEGRAARVAHNRSGDAPLFTLACDRPADLQLACQLCHLD